MRYEIYSSKKQNLVMLAIVLTAGALLFSIRQRLPGVWLGAAGMMIGLSLAGLLFGLFSSTPVIRMDEQGFRYYPKWFPLIEWKDVVSAERLPLVREMSDGETFHYTEATRPIRLTVRDRGKYLDRIPKFLQAGMFRGEAPDCLNIEMDFHGLDADSAKAYDCIQHYIYRPGGGKS